ncbi:hypothetical protein FEM48_Zijuj06G0182300 [Ziziphus jujuba var. spinosa]|uniref:Uncharacterized protein n=1 Tax=Ziziphus jujuba var. spinosa TaxID=714518 RepID=A0A978VAV0_ZIZJJ|nr:hypothetical protein FEM48_Zijuj06G0182300 [Ziziphus jujuba var. spinosa]
MGHIIAMVELGKLILHHYSHRFSITILLTKGFLDTPAVSTYIQHVSQSNPSICFHQFPFLSLQNFQSLSIAATGGEFIRQNLPNARDSLRQISETSTVRAFVIDLFCTSALCLGEEFRIPTFYFFTSGAAALAAFLYLPKIHEQTDKSFKDLADTVFRFPGLPPLRATHMPEPILDRDDPAYWDFLENSINLPKANGIVTNTFDGNVLVEDIAVAVAVEQREGDGFVSGDELEKRVRELMESEKGRELRERSKKMKEMALDALGEFGSSTLALKRFIAAIE